MARQRLNVIQWATGNIGVRSLRAVIEHPELVLAGLWVSSDAKAGKDAGTLCGLPETGIIARRSRAEMVAIRAECVLYMRQGTDIDEICDLLASGKNIVTTRGDFHYPPGMDPDTRARVEQACAIGKTSIYSTGSSPGFVTEALVLPLLSLSRRLDCLTISEFADMSSRNSPDLLFNIMGFGGEPGPMDQRKADHLKHDFAASLAQIADATGISVDRWQATGMASAARTAINIAAGQIPAGRTAAQRITICGMRDEKAVMRFHANWYCSHDIDHDDWELRQSGWRVQIDGDTPLDVSIGFPVKAEDYAAFTPGLTAHRAVNAVMAVCAAAPGIRTTADLGQVMPRF